MDREERISNFQEWIASGNELTVDDMLSVVVSHLLIHGENEYKQDLFCGNKIYTIEIKTQKVN